MSLKNLFGKLTGGASKSSGSTDTAVGDPVEHKGYVIQATPRADGGHYYTAGIITKSGPDGVREHRFIRADTHASAEAAASHAVTKARRIIDEQGERLFDDA